MAIMKLRVLIAFVLNMGPGICLAETAAWRSYVIPVQELRLIFPCLFLLRTRALRKGAGVVFTKDHRADLTIQSVPNHGNASPAEFLQKRRPPPGIQYKRVTPRFFVVSSIRNGRTWYNRCNRADGYMHCV